MASQSDQKQKLVFIFGLSRIGSTVLDMALGSQPHMTGLGEIYEVLRPEWKQYQGEMACTCGNSSSDCVFWQPFFEWLKNNEQADLQEKYQQCINTFHALYQQQHILIDSSKNTAALDVLLKIPNIELKIIYLIRDVRPWVISKLDDRHGNPEKFKKNGFYVKNLQYNLGFKAHLIARFIPYLSKYSWYYLFAWYYQNRAYKKALQQSKHAYYQISYETFALNPEKHLQSLIEFISGQTVNDVHIDLNNTASHIINGNPKRNDKQRKQRIFYDQRWFKRNEWLSGYCFFPWIRNYNQQQVYESTGIQKNSP